MDRLCSTARSLGERQGSPRKSSGPQTWKGNRYFGFRDVCGSKGIGVASLGWTDGGGSEEGIQNITAERKGF